MLNIFGDSAMTQHTSLHKSISAPQLKRFSSPTELKFAGKDGSFEGYAAVFNNVDSGGDVILPGAFKQFARTKDNRTIVLYQHSPRDPIGKADVSMDSHGLAFRAELALEDPTAKKAYGLMREGIIDSMSIGYDVLPGGEKYSPGKRELSSLKLFEISPVTWGMNELARIETVKSASACGNLRELEHLLRENLLLSSRKAKAAANALWPLLSDRDDQEDDRDDRKSASPIQLVEFAKELDQLTHLFRS
jgi:HK97 family phage prohead protease